MCGIRWGTFAAHPVENQPASLVDHKERDATGRHRSHSPPASLELVLPEKKDENNLIDPSCHSGSTRANACAGYRSISTPPPLPSHFQLPCSQLFCRFFQLSAQIEAGDPSQSRDEASKIDVSPPEKSKAHPRFNFGVAGRSGSSGWCCLWRCIRPLQLLREGPRNRITGRKILCERKRGARRKAPGRHT